MKYLDQKLANQKPTIDSDTYISKCQNPNCNHTKIFYHEPEEEDLICDECFSLALITYYYYKFQNKG
jgi:hypothetical protein